MATREDAVQQPKKPVADKPVETRVSDSMTVDAVDIEEGAPETPVNPMYDIAQLVMAVAEGRSGAGPLRAAVAHHCPADKDKARAYLEVMRRLRDSGEAVYQAASEQVSFVLNR